MSCVFFVCFLIHNDSALIPIMKTILAIKGIYSLEFNKKSLIYFVLLLIWWYHYASWFFLKMIANNSQMIIKECFFASS